MSEPAAPRSRARRHQSSAPAYGISTWAGTVIVVAALITGLLLSVNNTVIGLPYLLCFIIASLLVTVLVELRGLFLTVAQLPLLFGIATPITSWLVNRGHVSSGTPAFSKTMLLTAAFPLAQYFPHLALTTAGCTAIAFLRLRNARHKARSQQRRFEQERIQTAEAEQRNRATASRVREMTARTRRPQSHQTAEKRVTVEQLVRRADKEPRGRRIDPARRVGTAGRSEQARRKDPVERVDQAWRVNAERRPGSGQRHERHDRAATERRTSIPPRTRRGESIRDMPRDSLRQTPPRSQRQMPTDSGRRRSLDDDLYS